VSPIGLTEIVQLLNECETVNATSSGLASLPCMEPELDVKLVAGDHGHIAATIETTPDDLTHAHSFTFEIDQSYLPGIIAGCRETLEKYPVRGASDEHR